MFKPGYQRSLVWICACHALALHSIAAAAEEMEPIADNSFLIEEGYNQDAGIVQHISSLLYQRGGQFAFAFTQEFPLISKRHQLSYTVPVARLEGDTGIGDIFLNYRYQLVDTERLAFAPRLSLLLPSGDERKGLGAGGASIQVNLPLSAQLSQHFVAHTNVGATYTPRARDADGNRNDTLSPNLGQSIIWLARPRFNVLLEAFWLRQETVAGPNSRTHEDTFLINPGIRWAYDFSNGLQIVPGIGFPIGVGPSHGDYGVFLYLSFEHPFTKAAAK